MNFSLAGMTIQVEANKNVNTRVLQVPKTPRSGRAFIKVDDYFSPIVTDTDDDSLKGLTIFQLANSCCVANKKIERQQQEMIGVEQEVSIEEKWKISLKIIHQWFVKKACSQVKVVPTEAPCRSCGSYCFLMKEASSYKNSSIQINTFLCLLTAEINAVLFNSLDHEKKEVSTTLFNNEHAKGELNFLFEEVINKIIKLFVYKALLLFPTDYSYEKYSEYIFDDITQHIFNRGRKLKSKDNFLLKEKAPQFYNIFADIQGNFFETKLHYFKKKITWFIINPCYFEGHFWGFKIFPINYEHLRQKKHSEEIIKMHEEMAAELKFLNDVDDEQGSFFSFFQDIAFSQVTDEKIAAIDSKTLKPSF